MAPKQLFWWHIWDGAQESLIRPALEFCPRFCQGYFDLWREVLDPLLGKSQD
ncbi:MAG: hypothetical protein R3E79_07665 [Caldilineaceae bacterium]